MPPEEKDDIKKSPPSSLLNEPKGSINSDVEINNRPKLKYPKSVFFIVSNEFCERFCYYGMRTILALYLHQILGYSEDTSTTIYHAFVSFAYLTPVLGAIISDTWLGKFKTIFYLSIVYAIGSITMSLAAMPDVLPPYAFTFIGLFLIGLGTGGIKPCVSAFGGDQFVVPEQERQLKQFFSVFYFSVNSGSLISTLVTPILREDVQCFGMDSCYSLAFGVPAMLMVVSIIIFVSGYPLYKIKKPEGNILLEVFRCIGNAISVKRKNKSIKKDSWLDYSEEKYGKKFVEEIKTVLHVLVLFLPLPIFWALFDQQGSRWTFQASRMDGDFGGFVIYPDQIQAFNPAIVLFLIPIFEGVIYPFLARFNILVKPLRRMTVGGLLAGLAFLISAFVELSIKPSLAVIPGSGEAQLRIYNSLNCKVVIDLSGPGISSSEPHEVAPLDEYYRMFTNAMDKQEFNMQVRPDASCNGVVEQSFKGLYYQEKKALTYTIFTDGLQNSNLTIHGEPFEEDLEKSNDGNSKLRVIHNLDMEGTFTLTFVKKSGGYKASYTIINDGWTPSQEIEFGEYQVMIDDQVIDDYVYPEMGGVYNYVLSKDAGGKYIGELNTITTANSVNILWQIPQYVTITSAEVMFSITGLEFAFTQAPLAMKSVVTAAWLLTVSFGNIIVIIIAEAKFVNDPMWELVLFAVLMVAFMFIFWIMTLRYKYVTVATEDSLKAIDDDDKKKSHENGGFDDDHKD